MTFRSSGCIHAIDLILVSILTFTMLGIAKYSKSVTCFDGWPWKWRSNTFLYGLSYLWLQTSYRHDLCIDFDIFEAWDIENVEIYVSQTFDLGTQGHTHFSYDLAHLKLYACYWLDLDVDSNIYYVEEDAILFLDLDYVQLGPGLISLLRLDPLHELFIVQIWYLFCFSFWVFLCAINATWFDLKKTQSLALMIDLDFQG